MVGEVSVMVNQLRKNATQSPKATRQNQRDVMTILVNSVMVIVAYVFDIRDPEVIGAMSTILIIAVHRGAPDAASRGT